MESGVGFQVHLSQKPILLTTICIFSISSSWLFSPIIYSVTSNCSYVCIKCSVSWIVFRGNWQKINSKDIKEQWHLFAWVSRNPEVEWVTGLACLDSKVDITELYPICHWSATETGLVSSHCSPSTMQNMSFPCHIWWDIERYFSEIPNTSFHLIDLNDILCSFPNILWDGTLNWINQGWIVYQEFVNDVSCNRLLNNTRILFGKRRASIDYNRESKVFPTQLQLWNIFHIVIQKIARDSMRVAITFMEKLVLLISFSTRVKSSVLLDSSFGTRKEI